GDSRGCPVACAKVQSTVHRPTRPREWPRECHQHSGAVAGRARRNHGNNVRPTDITVQATTDHPEDGHTVEITRSKSVGLRGAGAARSQSKRRDRQAPNGRPLDTYGSNPSTAGQDVAKEGSESRSGRYRARRAIQPLMEGPAFRNLRACGRTSVLTGGEVTVKVSGR